MYHAGEDPHPKLISNRQLKAIGILIAIVVALAALGALQRAVFDNDRVAPQQNITIFQDSFADMNGDGVVDYVLYAEAVINGPTATAPSPIMEVPNSKPVKVVVTPVDENEPKPISSYTEEDWAALDEGQGIPHPRREPDRLVTVKVSWYDPELGGINCSAPCDRTANGSYVPDWYHKGAACVPSWPMGTVFEVGGYRFQCIDRGGAIQEVRPGVYWVDMLLHQPIFPPGSELSASVWFPVGQQ